MVKLTHNFCRQIRITLSML